MRTRFVYIFSFYFFSLILMGGGPFQAVAAYQQYVQALKDKTAVNFKLKNQLNENENSKECKCFKFNEFIKKSKANWQLSGLSFNQNSKVGNIYQNHYWKNIETSINYPPPEC